MTGSTGLGKRRWLLVGVALVVAGVMLLVGSVVYQASQVVDHKTVLIRGAYVYFGPYDLEEGDYTVWIEDNFPGFDNGRYYRVEAKDETGSEARGAQSNEYTTRTIDWVDCEEGEWTFIIRSSNETTEEDPVHVFIVRMDNDGPAIVFSAGVVCLSLGLIATGLVVWARKRRGPPHHQDGAM